MAQPLEILRRQMDAVCPGDRIERNLVEAPHAFVRAQHGAEGRDDEREEDAKHLGHMDLSLYKLLIMITRRSFLGGLAAASVARALRVRAAAALDTPRVDPRALRERLEALSIFGRPPGGVFADGVSRVAYSDADVEGRRYVIGLMKAAQLEPRIDPGGNVFGRRAGTEPALPPILFGS